MQQVDHQHNIIEVQDLSFAYPGQEPVLHKSSFALHKGDYVGLVGPNGSGKTTLLKLMLNLLKPLSGTVKLFGKNIRQFQDWGRIGYVPQKATGFDPQFPATVAEVVAMGRVTGQSLFKRSGKADAQAVTAALMQVEMQAHRDRLIGDLSGGQQQRVFIARSLVNDPEVIFLDEPTTGTDARSQDSFYALLRKLNRDFGLTIVLISHDIARITKEAMHIACIDKSVTWHNSATDYLRECAVENVVTIHQHTH